MKGRGEPVELQDGLCLGLIGLQSLCDCVRFVIIPLDQRLPCYIVKTLEKSCGEKKKFYSTFSYLLVSVSIINGQFSEVTTPSGVGSNLEE